MSRFKLKQVGEIVTGKTPSFSNPEDFGLETMFITPVDMNNKYVTVTERYLSSEGVDKLKSKLLPPNSVIVSCIGSDMGKVVMNTDYAITNQQLNSIIVDTDKFNSDYIYYSLKNAYKILRTLASGSTAVPLLNKTDFSDIELEIPIKKVQNKVSRVLRVIDEKIELNIKINQELEKLAKTIYDYWFMQFEFPNEEGKPYKSSGGKMVYNEELKREIPEGWKAENLNTNSLSTLIKAGIDEFEGKKHYLATADVGNNNINLNPSMITCLNRESRANMQPIKNSIWFSKMKNSKKVLYFGDYSTEFINKYILSTGFCGLKCTNESLEYMWNFINNDSFENVKDRLAHGATQQAVNNNDLKDIKIIVPDNKTLLLYHNKTMSIYEKVYKNQLQNQELAQLRDWLLPMLMNGQVTIK